MSPSRAELGHIRAKGRETRRKAIQEFSSTKETVAARSNPREAADPADLVDMQDSGDPEPEVAPAAAPQLIARSAAPAVPNPPSATTDQ